MVMRYHLGLGVGHVNVNSAAGAYPCASLRATGTAHMDVDLETEKLGHSPTDLDRKVAHSDEEDDSEEDSSSDQDGQADEDEGEYPPDVDESSDAGSSYLAYSEYDD